MIFPQGGFVAWQVELMPFSLTVIVALHTGVHSGAIAIVTGHDKAYPGIMEAKL